MSIRIEDKKGNKISIPLLKGDIPEKGKDYFTEDDKLELIQEISEDLNLTYIYKDTIYLSKLPEKNNLKIYYKNDNTEIKECEWEILPKNQIGEIAIDTDDTPYNGGLGYKIGVKLNTSGNEVTSLAEGHVVSGFLPVKEDYILKISGNGNASKSSGEVIVLYDEEFNVVRVLSTNNWFRTNNLQGLSLNEETGIISISSVISYQDSAEKDYIYAPTYVRFCALTPAKDIIAYYEKK